MWNTEEGWLESVQSVMKLEDYQGAAVLCLSRQSLLIQQNNDLKQTSQRTDERKTLVETLFWSGCHDMVLLRGH